MGLTSAGTGLLALSGHAGPSPVQLLCTKSRKVLQLARPQGAWCRNVQEQSVQPGSQDGDRDGEATAGARPGLAFWRSRQAHSGPVSPDTLVLVGPWVATRSRSPCFCHRDPI